MNPVDKFLDTFDLSEKMREVACYILQTNLNNAEIAEELGTSTHNVNNFIWRLYIQVEKETDEINQMGQRYKRYAFKNIYIHFLEDEVLK